MAKIEIAKYTVGAVLRARSARLVEESTKPPEYYTESTLLDDMVGAYKFAKTPEDRAMLKETNGIGTARTREPAISDLFKNGSFERFGKKKQYIKDTAKSRFLTDIAPEPMKDVAMTAKWEALLGKVAKGELPPENFRVAMRKFTWAIVEQARQLHAKRTGQATDVAKKP